MASFFVCIIFLISLFNAPLHGMDSNSCSESNKNIPQDYKLLRSYMQAINDNDLAAVHSLKSHTINLDLYYADTREARVLRDEFNLSPVDFAVTQTLRIKQEESYNILDDVVARSHQCPLSKRNSKPFHKIVHTKATDCIECFFDKDGNSHFDINSYDIKGKTPLHYAAENNDETMIRWLLYRGARIKNSTTKLSLKFFKRLPQDLAECNEIKELLNEAFARQSAPK